MDIEHIEAERAARKEALANAKAEQFAADLAALNDLEVEHGDENVARVGVGRYSLGLPTLVVVRPLSKPELKRFRDRVRGENADAASAADEAGASAMLYPTKDSELYAALIAAAPGVLTRAGTAAVQLAAGMAASEGK